MVDRWGAVLAEEPLNCSTVSWLGSNWSGHSTELLIGSSSAKADLGQELGIRQQCGN